MKALDELRRTLCCLSAVHAKASGGKVPCEDAVSLRAHIWRAGLHETLHALAGDLESEFVACSAGADEQRRPGRLPEPMVQPLPEHRHARHNN